MDAGIELAVGRGAVDDGVRALTQIVRVTVDELKLPLAPSVERWEEPNGRVMIDSFR